MLKCDAYKLKFSELLLSYSRYRNMLTTSKASTHVFTPKSLCFEIVALILTFQVPHGSAWFNYTKDNTQFVQFTQPAIPTYPDGNGFARGSIDLGGLRVYEAQFFNKIWTINEGGYNNFGTSFYEPAQLPEGYNLLGHFSHPNGKPIYNSVLVAHDTTDDPNNPALAKPMAYALMWCSEGVSISKDGEGYIWLPIPPNGYLPVGQIVTKTRDMPSLDIVRVVRQDLTMALEVDQWVWGNEQFNVHTTRPLDRGVKSQSVPVGTFMAIDGPAHSPALACLKRAQPDKSTMPTIPQVQAMVEAYSPLVYFHPNEEYLPSSVEWFFANGALLYQNGQSSGQPIHPHGWSLPLNGSVDDYSIDLPSEGTTRDTLQRGDLQDAKAYVHVKPAFGATYTDLAIWLFYPFNGPGKFQFGPVTIKFKRLGEHVSDWEHLTLRVDNFNGGLKSIYLSEHNKGTWINAMEFDYESGGRPVVYSSLHGHAHYSSSGQFIHGQKSVTESSNLHFQEKGLGIGVRDDTSKSNNVMDIRKQYEILQSDANTLLRQAWLYYPGRWGPKITYNTEDEIDSATSWLPGKLKDDVRKILKSLPAEVFGEEGPQGPLMKDSWAGDERI